MTGNTARAVREGVPVDALHSQNAIGLCILFCDFFLGRYPPPPPSPIINQSTNQLTAFDVIYSVTVSVSRAVASICIGNQGTSRGDNGGGGGGGGGV